jgi:hypothetical protein
MVMVYERWDSNPRGFTPRELKPRALTAQPLSFNGTSLNRGYSTGTGLEPAHH